MFNMSEFDEFMIAVEDINMEKLHESEEADEFINEQLCTLTENVYSSSLSLDEKIKVLKEISSKKTKVFPFKLMSVEEMFEELEEDDEIWSW